MCLPSGCREEERRWRRRRRRRNLIRIAYLEIRNLDSHERKTFSYWIGGSVVGV